jgi:hypothetical protein
MQRLRTAFMAGATLIAASAGAGAQMRGSANIPAGYQPPPGMCRVWYSGVAPGRQPAPTDCGTARSRVTGNSFLVYGAQGTAQRNGRYDSRGNGQGSWWGDQINNRGANDGRYDTRSNDGRYDGRSDKERRKREKERDKEWRKAHKGNGHDDGDDDRRDGNDARRDRNDDHRDHDRNDNHQGTWNSRVGNGRTNGQCTDLNRDGICDNQQGTGRVRIP